MRSTKKVKEMYHKTPDNSANELLRAKMRVKYHLLKDESLNIEDRDQLLNHVCTILGMNRPQLDNVLIDL